MNGYRSPYITCHGPSMHPALRPGDGLILRECAGLTDLRRGDIVVYPHRTEPYDVAHRVVRVSRGGIVTRGDNTDRPDPELVPWAEIRGRVVQVRREAKSFRPASGRRGQAVHRIGSARHSLLRALAPSLRLAFGLAEKSGLFHLFRPLVKTSVAVFGSNGSERYLLRYKNKIIGRKSASTGGVWMIRFPYRLVLNKDRLP